MSIRIPVPAAPGSAAADPGEARAKQLAQLIENHNRALHAFLMTRVRDEQEAKEIAQEAYVQLLQLDHPEAIGFLRAYLFRTAANIAINRAKQRRVRSALDQIDTGDATVDQLTPERRVLAGQELEMFERALMELPPKCRRAFVFFRFHEMSQQEIAQALGIQERMVRHYLFQAGMYCKLRIRGWSSTQARQQLRK